MALLEPDVATLAPPPGEPAADRAPDWIAAGTPEPLRSELNELLGSERVLSRASDLIRYASDASPYRMFPKAVVMAHDAVDVARVFEYGRRKGVPVTLRAGGTSLNGQSQTTGILVDVRRHFTGITVNDDATIARVGPGNVLGHVNKVLAPHGRKLGPDPASKDIATVGGVVANNAGGMRCGTTFDSYSTVCDMTFVLPSGTVIDTSRPDAAERFADAEPELAAGLGQIRDEIRADAELVGRIRHKFEIKNTTGYRLCAFLDADQPVEIFRRLLVGSEGTLGFISEVQMETIPKPAKTTLAWLHFPDIATAVDPVPELIAAGATAVELMVAPALIVASWNMPGAPEQWRELEPTSAALLVEFGGDDDAALDAYVMGAEKILQGLELIRDYEFTRDEQTIELNWRVREGLHGLVGKLKPPEAALVVEDVCVPPARIAECAVELQALLTEHGFLGGVAGHASAGNLHFMLTPDFSKTEDLERYEAFMSKLVEMIIGKYDGSLKAEHGTGINMAPYLEREWGEHATELMWRVKRLADPDGLLSPGVVLSRDPGIHLRNLKATPVIEESANACVECGFCEPVCPSRNLTTTPRQRIVLRREMVRQAEGSPVQRALLDEFEYDVLETCAADGSCMLVCPVGIDTGALVKQLRSQQRSGAGERMALRVAKRWDKVEKGARGGLRMAASVSGVIGDAPLRGATRAMRAGVTRELVPEWGDAMPPAAAPRMPATSRDGAAAIYFPACINRMFGRSDEGPGRPSIQEALVEVSRRSGQPLWIPGDLAGSCCGVPWSSKGYKDGHAFMANQSVERFWGWSDAGRLPIVIDASSCTQGLTNVAEGVLTEENAERHAAMTIIDSVAWANDHLIPKLTIDRRIGSVTVHPTCSVREMGLEHSLEGLAGHLADRVVVPITATCCGFAGDRGFLHPELTASATSAETAEVEAADTDAHICSNRTCEVGLERATGERFESFIFLLEELTRP